MKATWARSISARCCVAVVAVPPRVLDRLGKGGVGGLERAGAAKRPAEVGEDDVRLGGLDRKEPACALELRRRRRELAAIERASTGASEEVTSRGVRASPALSRPSSTRMRYARS